MSIPKQILEIIKKVDEKTLTKKVNWERTSNPTEYKLTFKGGAVTIDNYEAADGSVWTDFGVYNNNGGLIERIAFLAGTEDYKLLLNVYNNVKESVLKINETYNNILSELDMI